MRVEGGGPRLFVAVPLPEAARAWVASIVERVRAGHDGGREVRWVRMDGLHLTLRFLGPTEPDRIPAVVEAVDEAAGAASRIAIRLAGAGAFPAHGRPRALWLGVPDGEGDLADLARSLDVALAARGWPAQGRPFRAHLTLARADGVRAGPATATALRDAVADSELRATVDRVVLFESRTGDGPARYKAIHEVPLA